MLFNNKLHYNTSFKLYIFIFFHFLKEYNKSKFGVLLGNFEKKL
jgi:hypothetical protein